MSLKKITLKDGLQVILSEYTSDDFDKVVDLFGSLSPEALRWGTPPYTREVIERWMQEIKNKIVLVAHFQNKIIGYCMIHGSSRPQYKGIRDFMIYIHQDFQNKGLGSTMTSMAVKLAKDEGLHRIELEVVTDNKIAVHIYEKTGFKIEGLMKDTFFGDDGKYLDMLVMGLLL